MYIYVCCIKWCWLRSNFQYFHIVGMRNFCRKNFHICWWYMIACFIGFCSHSFHQISNFGRSVSFSFFRFMAINMHSFCMNSNHNFILRNRGWVTVNRIRNSYQLTHIWLFEAWTKFQICIEYCRCVANEDLITRFIVIYCIILRH